MVLICKPIITIVMIMLQLDLRHDIRYAWTLHTADWYKEITPHDSDTALKTQHV